jgi:hypothetical protein
MAYARKGITICTEWLANPKLFGEFAVRSGYVEGFEIHRKDNDAGYTPENCVFLPRKEHRKIHGNGKPRRDVVK